MSKKKTKKAICFNCLKEFELNDNHAFIYFHNTKKKFGICYKCWKSIHFFIYRKDLE